ncbi:cytochrome P450 family protein [Streptomyces halobius]|uniref:P450-derived glycosyltransferase activator n=1 Tax=Streptomyces halobius TaxID=2879846 RepID=A0ABY4MJF9_9ACTN|nr:P450-derived glycosyltransferase activator [Streptomyces halobius]UQA97352.1 P450-derived glycosyltransferase activator [Streptomyces halobius]
MSDIQETRNRVEIGELGRRLQRAHGEVWLHQVKGDPYADVLRGHAEDPHPGYERIRALGPLWRSSMGAWVTADHDLAGTLLGEAWPHGPVTGEDAHVPADDAGLGGDAAHYERLRALVETTLSPSAATAVCERVVHGLARSFNLVTDLAERVPVDLLAETFGLSAPHHWELTASCAAAGVVLDGLLCPQRLDVTRRAVTAVGRLRALLTPPDGHPAADTRELALLLATAGVRTAARLVASAVLAVVDHPEEWSRVADAPEHAALVVTEALRYDPPVQLHPMVARADVEFAGQRVPAGERVVVLVGAANRDPEVFADPDRFVTGRPAGVLVPALYHRVTLPFARAQAEAVIRALVAAGRRPHRSGPHLRSRRSPVTRHLLSCPLATG